jgi:hypothetical protein
MDKPSLSGKVSTAVGTASQVAKDVCGYWGQKLSRKLLMPHDPQMYYNHLMSVATNYEQWAAAGLALDRLQGILSSNHPSVPLAVQLISTGM